MSPAPIAVYRRTITASVSRIWENVLDWEHLPWLHRSTFRSVTLLTAHADGWRAAATLQTPGAREFVIDVALERDALRYHSRTVAGAGTGTDIVTQLEPAGPHATRIIVEFFVPGVAAAHADAVGAGYAQLYARLWDEDEGMMVRRQRVLDARPARVVGAPVPLGDDATLRARLPLLVDVHGIRVRVADAGGRLVAFAATCPHLGGPLDDTPIENGCVTCPWHGYRFDVATGDSADGRGLCIEPAFHVARDARGAWVVVAR